MIRDIIATSTITVHGTGVYRLIGGGSIDNILGMSDGDEVIFLPDSTPGFNGGGNISAITASATAGRPVHFVMLNGIVFEVGPSTSATIPTPVSIFNGGTGQSTALDAFNALSPLSSKGQLLTHDGTDNVPQGIDTDGKVLTLNSATSTGLEWSTAGGAGPAGPAGPMGPEGPAGTDGEQGPPGITGAAGAAGSAGGTGPAGANGAQGPPGVDGSDGSDGNDGPPGVAGAAGATGGTGASGAIGPQGVPGQDGLDGEQGPMGPTGTTGPAGGGGGAFVRAVVTLPYSSRSHKGIIVTAASSTPSSNIILSLAGVAETDANSSDVVDMLAMQAVAGSGQFEFQANFLTPIGGPLSINYAIG